MIYHAIMLLRSWSAVLSSRPIFIANVEVDSAVGPKPGYKRPIKNSRCWNSHKALRKPTLWVLVVLVVLRGQAGRGSTQEGEGEHLSSLRLQFWMAVYLLLKERYTFKKRETPDDCGSHFLTREKRLHLLPDDGDPVSVPSQSLGAVSWWTGVETEMGGHYVSDRVQSTLWEVTRRGERLCTLGGDWCT